MLMRLFYSLLVLLVFWRTGPWRSRNNQLKIKPAVLTSWLSKYMPAEIPSAIVGFVDLAKEDAEDVIKRHLIYPKFRGVRQIIGKLEKRSDLSFTNENLLLNKCWQKNFALLEKHNLSCDLQLYPEQMNE